MKAVVIHGIKITSQAVLSEWVQYFGEIFKRYPLNCITKFPNGSIVCICCISSPKMDGFAFILLHTCMLFFFRG
jgi:hypothetical protein